MAASDPQHVDPKQYDSGAAALAAHMESQPYNVLYERPATRALIGDVDGLRTLDVACGAGSLTLDLINSGAEVVGSDGSSEMLALARDRLGPSTELHLQDCSDPFDWAVNESFDLIVMSLAYHYVNERAAFLSEMRRVLRNDGAFVISTHHPTDDWRRLGGSYFATGLNTDSWGSGQLVTSWRLPLTSITAEFADAGFVIERLVEPLPAPEMQHSAPAVFAELGECPAFILFRLRKLR